MSASVALFVRGSGSIPSARVALFVRDGGSPRARFPLFAQEQDLLTHLPITRFEMATWKVATVQPNYHISVDGMFYSVPFQYISQKFNVKSTSSLIEIFKADTRITSHQRLLGRKGQYQTVRDHMPKKHQKYLEWDEDRFLSWAENIGSSTRKLIQLLLAKYAIPQQGFRMQLITAITCISVSDDLL